MRCRQGLTELFESLKVEILTTWPFGIVSEHIPYVVLWLFSFSVSFFSVAEFCVLVVPQLCLGSRMPVPPQRTVANNHFGLETLKCNSYLIDYFYLVLGHVLVSCDLHDSFLVI